MISPILFHENKMMIPDISPTVLTTQPLLLCGHTRSINDFTTVMEVFTLGTCMTSYTYYITSNSDFMTSVVSIWDIICTAFMTSDLLYMTSHPWFMTFHPLYLWHHSNYISNITPTMFVNIYQLYLTWNTLIRQYNHCIWHHTLHVSVCVITPTVSMIKHTLYSWQHTHSIRHHILYTSDIKATVSMTRHLMCLWHHTLYIWHFTWCMNDNTTTVSDITLTVSV